VDVAKRLQELRAFDGDLHMQYPPDPTRACRGNAGRGKSASVDDTRQPDF
jgi:hypothetical protein